MYKMEAVLADTDVESYLLRFVMVNLVNLTQSRIA